MLYCYSPKIPQVFNKSLHEYCKRSTQESIKKLTEKYNSDKNKPKISNLLLSENGDSGKPEFTFYGFLVFLSISTIGFILYKRLK